MNPLVTRALLVSAALVAVVLSVFAMYLIVTDARTRAEDSDTRDSMTVAAVLAVTTDADAVRGTVARTLAGSEGRLAVRFPDGATIGVGRDDSVSRRAVSTVSGDVVTVEITTSKAVITGDLLVKVAALILLAGVAVAVAVRIGNRRVRPMLAGVRALSGYATEIAHGREIRINLTGPAELTALATGINAMADRTEELLAREREMIADVSHRLRTPLTALRLDADAIGPGAVADRIRTAVNTLEHDVTRIIESLRPVVSSNSETCDVATVVRARMLFWSAHAELLGRACEVDLPYEPTPVRLSADVLASVVDALLDNIFHYTPAHTALSVAVVRHAGWITLVVEDAGPGIADPEAALSRGQSGGGSTGLGLAIARAATEETGGTIHIERGQLDGTRIRLRFGEAHSHPESHEDPRAWRLWRHHS